MENGTEDRKILEELLEDKERRLQELERELRSVRKRSRSYKKECKQLREGWTKRTKTESSQTPYHLMRPPPRTTTCCICQISIFSRDADTQTFETDFDPDFDSANSALDWQPMTDGKSIVDIVKETAQAAMTKSDYVFDEASQMYYSVTTGYYYEPKRKLFYEPHSRVYYSYDEETCEYAFHSQLVDDHLITNDAAGRRSRRHRRRHQNSRNNKKEMLTLFDDLEEGEVREDLDSAAGSSNSGESDSASAYPPSLRMIVERSETLREGSLLLVTYKGATIGREETCDLCIPDTSVSRVHAKISYEDASAEESVYTLRDLGSQNGTFVNDSRIPCEEGRTIEHGDRVSFGVSSLLIHMHDGHNTCNGCEPGLLLDSSGSATISSAPVLSKHQREEERKQQLRQMKKRYGLASSDYEADKQSNIEKHGYKDRADHRRRTDGSINPYEKDAEPASLNNPVPINNKGYKMLKQMGWDKGQGLGLGKMGILEPISVNTQFNRAGLGTRTNALE